MNPLNLEGDIIGYAFCFDEYGNRLEDFSGIQVVTEPDRKYSAVTDKHGFYELNTPYSFPCLGLFMAEPAVYPYRIALVWLFRGIKGLSAVCWILMAHDCLDDVWSSGCRCESMGFCLQGSAHHYTSGIFYYFWNRNSQYLLKFASFTDSDDGSPDMLY